MRKYKYLALVLFAVGLFTLLFNANSAAKAYACNLHPTSASDTCLVTTRNNILGNQSQGITGVSYTWINMSTIQAMFHASPPGNGTSYLFTNSTATQLYPYNDILFQPTGEQADCSTNGNSDMGAPMNNNLTQGGALWKFQTDKTFSCDSIPQGDDNPDLKVTLQDPLFEGIKASSIFYTHAAGDSSIGFSDGGIGDTNYKQCPNDPNEYVKGACQPMSCNPAIFVQPDNNIYLWPLSVASSSNSGRNMHNYEHTESQNSTDTYVKEMGAFGCPYITSADANGSGSGYQVSNGYNPMENEVILAYLSSHSQDSTVGKIRVYVPNLTYQKVTIPSGTNTTTGTASAGATGPSDASCQKSSSNPLTWVLCPIFNSVAHVSQWLLTTFVQSLLTTPIITFTNSHSQTSAIYVAWSNFRIYGDIVLVIAILVIVYAETIGGGVLDAYTVKKMLPRILISAILINLSIYIVAGLLDITQILGQGISNVITGPFQKAGIQDFHLSGAGQLGVISFGFFSAFLGAASFAGAIMAMVSGAGAAVLEMAFFLILPVLLGALAIVITLIIRLGVILLLLIVSPVAFALYCLPNSEQYFKRWWKLLLESLMVYPIIMLIAGVASVLSTTTLLSVNIKESQINTIATSGFSKAGIGATDGLVVIMAFFMQFLPLLAVPFAFRIAGGTLGRLNELLSNGAKQVNKLADSRRDVARKKYQSASLEGRGKAYQRFKDIASNRKAGAFQRASSRFLANRIGGYDLEHALSTQRAETKKGIEETIATGKDGEIRGLTVNKRTSQSRSKLDGTKQFRSLGGAWIDEADVDAGYARWGHDEFAQQAALAYEMRKVNTDDDSRYLTSNYNQVAAGWGLNEDQAGGVWKGSAFENQNQHLDYKYTDWKTGKIGDAEGFIQETYNKKGSYPLSQMHAETIKALSDLYQTNDGSVSADSKSRIAAISETFMHDLGTQQIGATGDGGAIPITAPAPGAAAGTATGGGRVTSTPGAAAVAERVRELAALTRTAPAIQGDTVTTGTSRTGEATSGSYNDGRRREQ